MASMGRLILVLWPLSLLDILMGNGVLSMAASALFALYLGAALLKSNWANRVLALLLVMACIAMVYLDQDWSRLAATFAETLVFAAFVPAIHLLRGVAERDPTVMAFQKRLRAAPPETQPAWMLIGSHILASVLSIGAVAVLAPVFSDPSQPARRREDALAALAGAALAMTWSPFFVGMAVVSGFLPDVPLGAAVLMGLGLSSTGLVLALVLMRTPRPFEAAWQTLLALRGFLPMIAAAGLAVVLLQAFTGLSTLQASCVALPPLCAVLILMPAGSWSEALARFRSVLHATRPRIERIGAEVGITALAFMLGLILRSSPSMAEAVASSGLARLPDAVVLVVIPLGAIAAAMLSIHSIVSVSLLLAVFAGHHTGVSDLALMGAALVGWSGSAMLSFSGLLVMVTTSLGGISRMQAILGRNLLFAPLFAVLAALILILFDRGVMG